MTESCWSVYRRWVLFGSVWRTPTRAWTRSSTIILRKTSATRFAVPSPHVQFARRAADVSTSAPLEAASAPSAGSVGRTSGSSGRWRRWMQPATSASHKRTWRIYSSSSSRIAPKTSTVCQTILTESIWKIEMAQRRWDQMVWLSITMHAFERQGTDSGPTAQYVTCLRESFVVRHSPLRRM